MLLLALLLDTGVRTGSSPASWSTVDRGAGTGVVVAVGAAVGRAQPNASAAVRVNQVDDLLGAAVGG
jgi:hypothetical protein